MRDLAVIITCLAEADWVARCVRSLLPALRGLDAEIVIADIEEAGTLTEPAANPLDRTRELSDQIRVVRCRNRGFAHANNEALRTCDARYILFLNPDTERVAGSFEELVAELDQRPEVGMVGVKQLTSEGDLYPTMRRQSHALRMIGEALGSERLAPRLRWGGHRHLDLDEYEYERPCDWTMGSFMLVRREAIMSAGFMDERFFFAAEEEDFCLRIRRAGWQIRHLPTMTIIHHVNKGAFNPRLECQRAFAKVQYARLNFAPMHRTVYLGGLALFYLRRMLTTSDPARRGAYRGALRIIAGIDPPPFGSPPRTALPSHSLRGRLTELDGLEASGHGGSSRGSGVSASAPKAGVSTGR